MIVTRIASSICGLMAVTLVPGLSGCAALQHKQAKEEKRTQAGQEATKEEVLSPAEMHMSAAALYNMGLIYVHYKNPNKKYEKAKAVFERVVKEYQDSPLAEEAKIWAGVLQVIEKFKQVDIDIEEKKKELSR